MAILRSYSATFEQNAFAQAAVTRYRFNEGSGSSDALDSIGDLDGTYQAGAAPGAAGGIGDGAASFNGSTGFVQVETLSGTITVSAFGDSLIGGDGFQAADQQFSPELERALEARGLDATVLDNGSNGRRVGELGDARVNDGIDVVDDIIAENPDVVIVELGTNDAINDIDVDTVETNLRDIITQLRAEEIQVLVTGTFGWYPEHNGGVGYDSAQERTDFEAIFANLVAEFSTIPGVVLLQDTEGSDKFLGGERVPGETPAEDTIVGGVLETGDPTTLADNPFTEDGLHPNEDGIDVIVPRIAPQAIALGAAAGVINEPLQLANGTFEVWFTADTVSGNRNIFAKNSEGQGTGGQVAMAVVGGEIVAAIGDTDGNFFVSGGPVAAGELTQAVLTFGAAGMELYVNGESVDTDAHTGGLEGNFEPLVIGAESGFSTPGTIDDLQRFFDGTIDEFAVYDRALTAGEIQQLFEAGELGGTLVGTAGADTLIGGSDAEDLRGAGGDDVINGNGGDDTLRGGGGTDTLRGGQGDDRILGGGGGDVLLGGPGNDMLRGMGGHDRLVGGGGDDLLEGGGGRDVLIGSSGADQLFGGRGIDVLRGGGGDDLLNGGPGPDLLRGGSGSDTFQIDRVSHGVDRIFDFEDGVGGDVLDLSAVLDLGENGNLDDFVRLRDVNSHSFVEVDANGGGDTFTAVFKLIGGAGLDINALINDGNIDLGTPTS